MPNENVTEKDVLRALSQVQDPDLKKDLVTLGMIKDVRVKDGEVSFTIVLTTPACPLKNKLENEPMAMKALDFLNREYPDFFAKNIARSEVTVQSI